MAFRSAKTGRYISRSAAARRPRQSVNESSGKSGSSGRTIHRSAGTGRFVNKAAVKRWPNHTLTEKV